uniref:Uncharacterized protein n=1 Tax=Cacopsylla melanoneura TaxID=428564 RepID=A0A8D8Z9E1_9HEMI
MFFVSNTFPSNVSSIFHPASLRSSSISLLCYPSCPWSHVSQIPHFPRVYPSCPWSYISIKSSTSSVFIPHVPMVLYFSSPPLPPRLSLMSLILCFSNPPRPPCLSFLALKRLLFL